jgi:aminoglycoside phosphotransferase family enzyme/predicted kinase
VSTPLRIDELLDPAAYPHPVSQPRLRETHVSWVVLTGAFAYKIKKPVRFDFLDASTLERRAALCAEELRLNRRLAPDLYLDVVPVTREAGRLRVGGSGRPVEFAVRMHQFDPSQELAEQLDRNAVTPEDMQALAALLAGLHARAGIAGADSPHGTFALLQAQVLANLAQLRPLLSAPQLQALEQPAGAMQAALRRLQPVITGRRDTGHVRECHGDLHAGNVVRWRQRWMAFDCLEFDPALRWIDVIADTAFLYMDIIAHGREALASELLSRYLEQTGDYAGLPLLRLHAGDRALVRAKVNALHAAAARPAERAALHAAVDARLGLAARLMAPAKPALVIMHGVAASGKSSLAARLVPALHGVRIRSDLERKRLAGVAPLALRNAAVGEGDYTAQSTRRTYERLLQCAEAAIDGGCTAIVDAAFLQAAQRTLFQELAARRGCRFLIACCTADTPTLRSRLLARAAGGEDPSEATPAVLEHQLRSVQPLTGQERRRSVQIDTARRDCNALAAPAIVQRLVEPRDVDT